MIFEHAINLIIGFIVGVGVVGTSVARTIAVGEKKTQKAVWHSALNSLFYFFSIYFIARNNYMAYTGTAIGSCIVVWLMARAKK